MSVLYSTVVDEYFRHLLHAGDTAIEPGFRSEEFSDRASGCAVRFWLRVPESGGVRCRFGARGCPHFLAACEFACRRIESGANWPDCEELMTTFCVPIEKTGRILLIVDALGRLREGLNDAPQSPDKGR